MKSNTDRLRNYARKHKLDSSKFMVYIILAAVLIIFSLWLGSTFFSGTNLMNIFRQTGMVAVMAVGMSFVIACGEIDLSVSGVVPLAGILAAVLLRDVGNTFAAVMLALLFGVVVGIVNGFFVTTFNIPAFLVTIGTQNILKGIAMWISSTKAIPIYDTTFNSLFGSTNIFGGVPTLLVWIVLALILGNFALHFLPFGRRVLAIGGSRIAAKYTGIKVKREIISTFAISGLCAAMAGLLYAGRTQTARYTFGVGDEMNIIAGVVLGGTAMSGGKASIFGAVVGALLIGIINNGLIVGGLDVSQQMIIKGAIIVLSVALNNVGSMKKE